MPLPKVTIPPGIPEDLKDQLMSYNGCNTYLVYLERQKLFVKWLVTAAAQFGEHVESIRPSQTETVIVPYSEALRLARIVAFRGTVPTRVMDYINFMLHVRGDWDPGNQKTREPVTDDNSIHVHFIAMSTLRIVRNILARAPIVEEESDPPNPDPKRTYSLPELPGEAFFAWVCFFNDLSVLRSYLRVHWDAYKHSLETLTTRTLITNTAIRLIRANCDAQIQATRHLPSMPDEREKHISNWVLGGVVGPPQQNATKNFNEWEHYEASWSCDTALYGLRVGMAFLKSFVNDEYPLFPYRQTSAYSEQSYFEGDYSPRRAMTNACFLFNTCISLHQLRLFFKDSPEDVGFLPCFDEITMGWMTWEPYLVGEIPLWLVISFQIWLDILTQLGGYSPTALQDLQEQAQDCVSLWRTHLGHAALEKARLEFELSYLSTIIRISKSRVIEDGFKKKIQDAQYKFAKLGFAGVPKEDAEGRDKLLTVEIPSEKFFFLKDHPLLCGMQSWWLEQQYRHFEWRAVNLHEAISPACLLHYSMCMSGFVKPKAWLDMRYTRNNPSGLNYAPESPSDGPYSLDALYCLLFDKTSDHRIHNLILAALCLDASLISSCEIPGREYLIKTWKDGIKRHADMLDISVKSAAAVLQPMIETKGSAGLVMMAQRQRSYYKTRGLMPPHLARYYEELRARRCRRPWNLKPEVHDSDTGGHSDSENDTEELARRKRSARNTGSRSSFKIDARQPTKGRNSSNTGRRSATRSGRGRRDRSLYSIESSTKLHEEVKLYALKHYKTHPWGLDTIVESGHSDDNGSLKTVGGNDEVYPEITMGDAAYPTLTAEQRAKRKS
ncbi:hypothetical protein GGR51DRAFT_576445 [Nemania sp. FL0031]|nr:hypothetical protein GGR51DRAFT_576445 [Nemania sp. FL0031]